MTALTIVALITAACGEDNAPTAGSSSAQTDPAAETTSTVTTEPASTTSAVPTTNTEPTTTAEPTTAAPTTTEAAATEWTAVGEMPSLAYLPCCASNYVGDPTPQIPADDDVTLEPGVYHASRAQPTEGQPVETATISFSLAPFVACGAPDIFCEEGFVDGEVGVGPAARDVTLSLTDDLNIVG